MTIDVFVTAVDSNRLVLRQHLGILKRAVWGTYLVIVEQYIVYFVFGTLGQGVSGHSKSSNPGGISRLVVAWIDLRRLADGVY